MPGCNTFVTSRSENIELDAHIVGFSLFMRCVYKKNYSLMPALSFSCTLNCCWLKTKQDHAGNTVLKILQGTIEGILLFETIKENVWCSEDSISSCID